MIDFVAWRLGTEHIRDKTGFAINPCLDKGFVQELAAAPYKRVAKASFLFARSFANKGQT